MGREVAGSTMHKSDLIDIMVEYQKYLEESGLSMVTIKSYVSEIKSYGFWLGCARTRPLLEGTGDDIEDYCRELVAEKAHSAATVNRRLQSIRKFYRYALQVGLVQEDPSLGLKLLPQPKSQARKGLSEPEIERLLEAVRQGPPRLARRDNAIVQLMLHTGIRVGELTGVRVSEVSLSEEQGVLTVRGQVAGQGREIPLNASLRQAIVAYLDERATSEDDHLFLSRKGSPLSVRSVQRLINSYARAAGLEGVSTYTLRQTCGELMLRDTSDLSLVARVMGHKRLETAIKYILPRQEDLTEVAEKSSLNLA
ncbi:MAG: tyrosine-type recombinase/integrase [Anaerolineae bacterium]